MVVVLPAPLGPSNPMISPRSIEKQTSSTARKSPKVLVRFSISTSIEFPPFRRAWISSAKNKTATECLHPWPSEAFYLNYLVNDDRTSQTHHHGNSPGSFR